MTEAGTTPWREPEAAFGAEPAMRQGYFAIR
jgi:hypothetical protein